MAKFPQFDEYQLAKYNKAAPKCVMVEGLEEEELQAMLRARDFTIKRLVCVWSLWVISFGHFRYVCFTSQALPTM